MEIFQFNRKSILKVASLLAFIFFFGQETIVLGIAAEIASIIEIGSLSIVFIAYLSSLKPFLKAAIANFEHFERYSWFTIPTKKWYLSIHLPCVY